MLEEFSPSILALEPPGWLTQYQLIDIASTTEIPRTAPLTLSEVEGLTTVCVSSSDTCLLDDSFCVVSTVPFPISASNKCTNVVYKMSKEQLHIRVNTEEYTKLERYCKKHKTSKSDVIRELIRSLSDGD